MAKEIKFNIKLAVDGKEQLVSATTDLKELRGVLDSTKTAGDRLTKSTLNLGGNALTYGAASGQYSVKWTVNGEVPASGKVDSKGQLTVDRDMVNGIAYVVCEFSVGGTVVESDGYRGPRSTRGTRGWRIEGGGAKGSRRPIKVDMVL